MRHHWPVARIADLPGELEHELAHARTTPPYASLGYALRRYWFLVLLVVALFTAGGLYAARQRAAVYTAETRLAVGRVDITPGTLSTFTGAAQALAGQYSRAVRADGVVRRAAPRAGLTPAQVAGRISATPIPQSPVIRLMAVGRNADDAVRLANAAAAGLIGYTTTLNRSNPDATRLLNQYRDISGRVLRLRRALATARKRHAAAPTDRTRRRVDAARVDLTVAQLQQDTIRGTYDATERTQGSTSLLQVLSPARAAASDRGRYVQTLGFVGLAVGLAVGVALAMLLATTRIRRRALRP
jgi:uncharacterized protein involved in exopolysaccharide biosynthesis